MVSFSQDSIPSQFDWRIEFPSLCQPLFQGSCNNCWAYCTSQCFSDRIKLWSCYGVSEKTLSIFPDEIVTEEYVISPTNLPLLTTREEELSPLYFTSCKFRPSKPILQEDPKEFSSLGCDGGSLQACHLYLVLKGLPSQSNDQCDAKNLFRAKNVYRVTNPSWSDRDKEIAIQEEIYHRGPVSCGYVRPTSHAVSLIGWDEENWIVRNSKEPFYFKYPRGRNIGLIEEDVWGIEPFSYYSPS